MIRRLELPASSGTMDHLAILASLAMWNRRLATNNAIVALRHLVATSSDIFSQCQCCWHTGPAQKRVITRSRGRIKVSNVLYLHKNRCDRCLFFFFATFCQMSCHKGIIAATFLYIYIFIFRVWGKILDDVQPRPYFPKMLLHICISLEMALRVIFLKRKDLPRRQSCLRYCCPFLQRTSCNSFLDISTLASSRLQRLLNAFL